MKECYRIKGRIETHNENCKANCVSFVENNITKYSIEELEARLCDYCKTEWRGTKRIWQFLGHSPSI